METRESFDIGRGEQPAYCQCCGHMGGVCPRCGAEHVPAYNHGCEACETLRLLDRVLAPAPGAPLTTEAPPSAQQRLDAWRVRWMRVMRRAPDVRQHVRQMTRGVRWPATQQGERRSLSLRPLGEPRMPA